MTSQRPSRGYKAGGSDFALARLLRCPTCGTRLTGTRDRVDGKNKGRVRYACRLGTAIPHPRITISEHLIMPAIREEAEHLVTPEQRHAIIGSDDTGERAALEARRERIIDLYESGLIERAERERRLEAVTDKLASLDARQVVLAVPSRINWDAEPRAVNAFLRALFDRIDLDPETFQPTHFEWTAPDWRRPAAKIEAR